MFISCLRLSSSNMRIVSSHKHCVAELYLQSTAIDWLGDQGSSWLLKRFRVTIHVWNTAPGTVSRSTCLEKTRLLWWGPGSLWFLTATLGSSNESVVPKSVVLLSGTKVCNLYLQYVLIGPTLGAKVCHQL